MKKRNFGSKYVDIRNTVLLMIFFKYILVRKEQGERVLTNAPDNYRMVSVIIGVDCLRRLM